METGPPIFNIAYITIHNWKGLCTLFWKWNKKYVLRFTNLFKDENIQTQILDAALKFVPEHGWTKTAIENGIDEMKLPKISAGIISNGPIDLVHHHYEKSNNLLGKINIITSLHSVNEWIEFRVTFVVTKGQIKSEWILKIINFPKYEPKNLKDSALKVFIAFLGLPESSLGLPVGFLI